MPQRIPTLTGIALFIVLAWSCSAAAQSAPASDKPADAANKPTDAPANPAPKKVYTNDDLHGMQRGDVSVVGNSKAERPGRDSSTGKKDEQYWHNRAQRIRDQIADVDRQIADYMKAEQGAANVGVSSSTPPPPGAYTLGARSRSTAQIQRLQNRKAALEQQMDQLQEEARRAGVPPGWLR